MKSGPAWSMACFTLIFVFGCGGSKGGTDTVDVDSAVTDTGLDSGASDAGDTGQETDAPSDTKTGDICGPFNPDPIHVEGQACDTEGESFCIEDGSYVQLIPDFSLQCIRPGFIKCAQNPASGTLMWQKFNCEDVVSSEATECGVRVGAVLCVQADRQALCCPWTARTDAAGNGILCSKGDTGKSRCGYGSFTKGGAVNTCNILSQAKSLYPREAIPPEVSSDKCDYIFESCSYWFSSESCPSQTLCSHPKACESGLDGYGNPVDFCPGACIRDTVNNVDRCAATCQDLYDFYQD